MRSYPVVATLLGILLLVPSWSLGRQLQETLVIATIESWDIHFEVPGEGSRQVYSGKAMLAVGDVLLARQDLVHQRFFRVGETSKVVLVVDEEELPSWLANPTEERIFLLYPLEGSPAFRVVGAFDNTEENLRTLGMR